MLKLKYGQTIYSRIHTRSDRANPGAGYEKQKKIVSAIEAFEVLDTEYKNINKLDYDLYEIKSKGVRAYFRYDTDRRKIIIVGFICLKETQKAPGQYMKQAARSIEAYKRRIKND